MTSSDDTQNVGGASSSRCLHSWLPLADSKRIWQKCVKCGEEQHVATHAEQTLSMLSYIFRDFS